MFDLLLAKFQIVLQQRAVRLRELCVVTAELIAEPGNITSSLILQELNSKVEALESHLTNLAEEMQTPIESGTCTACSTHTLETNRFLSHPDSGPHYV